MTTTPEAQGDAVTEQYFALLDALQPVDTPFCRALSDEDLRMLWRELDTALLFTRMERNRRAKEGDPL